MQDAQSLYREGVQAIRDEKDMELGRQLLTQSLRLDPNNDMGWLWLSRAVADDGTKLRCIERALEINPSNTKAQTLKQRLQGGGSRSRVSSPPARSMKSKAKPKRKQSGDGDRKSKAAVGGIDPAKLGKVVTSSSMKTSRSTTRIILLLFSLPIGIGFLLAALGVFDTADSNSDSGLNIAAAAMAALFLFASMYFLYELVANMGQKVILTEGGLVLVRGRSEKAWGWDDFTAVKIKETTSTADANKTAAAVAGGVIGVLIVNLLFPDKSEETDYSLELYIDKERVLKLSKSYKDHRKIGDMIRRAMGRALLPILHERYENGETLEFGKIKVTPDEVVRGRKRIRWDNIHSSYTQERDKGGDELFISHADGDETWNINNVPNAHVLVMLMDRIAQSRTFNEY